MAARKQPITRRYAGQWIAKGKVWTPSKSALYYEGPVDESVGQLIETLYAISFTQKPPKPEIKRVIQNAYKKLLSLA